MNSDAQVREVKEKGLSCFTVLPFLVLENHLPGSLRVIFRSTASKTQKEGARSWRERTLKLFPAIEESQGFILKSGTTHNIYHDFFDGEGEVSLKLVGTDDRFELQTEKIEDGTEKVLRAAIADAQELRRRIQLKFLDGQCRIEAEYIIVNQTDKDLKIEVSTTFSHVYSIKIPGGLQQHVQRPIRIVSVHHTTSTELITQSATAHS